MRENTLGLDRAKTGMSALEHLPLILPGPNQDPVTDHRGAFGAHLVLQLSHEQLVVGVRPPDSTVGAKFPLDLLKESDQMLTRL